jgi:hypothetical protein
MTARWVTRLRRVENRCKKELLGGDRVAPGGAVNVWIGQPDMGIMERILVQSRAVNCKTALFRYSRLTENALRRITRTAQYGMARDRSAILRKAGAGAEAWRPMGRSEERPM